MRPLDKHATTASPVKPLTPSMSSSLRNTKSPLTPKLAGYNASQPTRKHARSESLIPEPSSPPTLSPRQSFHANVTPRSGHRKSRQYGVSSPAETPSGAQNGTRIPLSSSTNNVPQTESSLRDGQRSLKGRTLHTGALTYTSNSRPGSSCGSSVGTMFFHADDAKSSVSSYEQEPRPPLYVAKNSSAKSFMYANGQREENLNPRDYSRQSGSLNKRPGGPYVAPTLAKAPDLPTPRQEPQSQLAISRESVTVAERDQRRRSIQSSYFPQDSNPAHFSQSHSHSPSLHGPSPLSPQSPPQRLHLRSVSTDASQTARQVNPLLMSPPSYPASLAGDQGSQMNANSPDLSPRAPSGQGLPPAIDILHPFPRATSPSKSDAQPQSGGLKMSGSSASARHERKVLDLEISNSSLLAINRALEREMRKQTAELRRFRRLSRSGRLSMTPSHRSASGGLSVVSETDDGQSLCGTPGELSDSDDNISMSDEGSMTPGSVAENDARHSARDEKRFLQDLSKHKQLLIDSQRMNQSLKRCLGWTENLIAEARKALEYKVKVSDIEIGGRVLSPDEVEGEWEGGKGLLSPTTDLPPLEDSDDFDELAESDSDEDEESIA